MSVNRVEASSPAGQVAVHYRVLGPAGAPWLVACHGMALDHRDLVFAAEAFADRWRILLWDMPGHGRSPPMTGRVSVSSMTDALEAVIFRAGVVAPLLLGFSFGGMVAQSWIRRHPGVAAGLVAYGCLAPFSQTPPVSRWLANAIAHGTYGLKSWTTIRDEFARSCALTAAGQEYVREAMGPLGKRGFMSMARALLEGFDPDPMFRIDCPLLLIRGSEDSNASLLDAADAGLRAIRPDARQVGIAGAGHCAHLDAPEAFLTCLRPFFDEILQAERSTCTGPS